MLLDTHAFLWSGTILTSGVLSFATMLSLSLKRVGRCAPDCSGAARDCQERLPAQPCELLGDGHQGQLPTGVDRFVQQPLVLNGFTLLPVALEHVAAVASQH